MELRVFAFIEIALSLIILLSLMALSKVFLQISGWLLSVNFAILYEISIRKSGLISS